MTDTAQGTDGVRLTPHEIAFLEMLDGGPDFWPDGKPMTWGACMSECVEALNGGGYVTYPTVNLTEKGRAFLTARKGGYHE